MLSFDVRCRKAQVHAHRCQARVSHDLLQAEDVPTVEYIILGQSVPEGVRRASHPGDAGSLTEPSHHLLDTVLCQGQPAGVQKQPAYAPG